MYISCFPTPFIEATNLSLLFWIWGYDTLGETITEVLKLGICKMSNF